MALDTHSDFQIALKKFNKDYKKLVTKPKELDSSSSSIKIKHAKTIIYATEQQRVAFIERNILQGKNEAEITILMNSEQFEIKEFKTKYAINLLPRLQNLSLDLASPEIIQLEETAAQIEKLVSNFNLIANHLVKLNVKADSPYSKANKYLQKPGRNPDSSKYKKRIYQAESQKLSVEFKTLVPVFYRQREALMNAVCSSGEISIKNFWAVLNTSVSAPNPDSFQRAYETASVIIFVHWFVHKVLDPIANYLKNNSKQEIKKQDISFANTYYLLERKAELSQINGSSTITNTEKELLKTLIDSAFGELLLVHNSSVIADIETNVNNVFEDAFTVNTDPNQPPRIDALKNKITIAIQNLSTLIGSEIGNKEKAPLSISDIGSSSSSSSSPIPPPRTKPSPSVPPRKPSTVNPAAVPGTTFSATKTPPPPVPPRTPPPSPM